jgi:hypothetical protein
MESEEHNLQGKLKKVLVAMEIKRTDFDNIRQDVNKIKKYAISFLLINIRNIFCDI